MSNISKYIRLSARMLKAYDGIDILQFSPEESQTVVLIDIDYCLYHNQDFKDAENKFIQGVRSKLDPANTIDWKAKAAEFGSIKLHLNNEFGFSSREIHDFYDFNKFDGYFSADPELKKRLELVRYKKFCFTNGYEKKAKRILQDLGIEDCFGKIFCADEVDNEFILKPREESFLKVEQFLKKASFPGLRIIFLDDQEKNFSVPRGKLHWECHLIKSKCDLFKCLEALAQESARSMSIAAYN